MLSKVIKFLGYVKYPAIFLMVITFVFQQLDESASSLACQGEVIDTFYEKPEDKLQAGLACKNGFPVNKAVMDAAFN